MTGTSKADSSIGFMKIAARNCEIAHLRAIGLALDSAFNQIRANPRVLSAAPRAPVAARARAPARGHR